jgi:putative phosphoesterase
LKQPDRIANFGKNFVVAVFTSALNTKPDNIYLLMKKIGIISDTHGYMDDRIRHFLSDRDEIWHAGDWGNIAVSDKLVSIALLRGVYGNIDGTDIRLTYPKDLRFMCEGIEVFITHIGGYPGKYAPDIRKELQLKPPNLFICGHSHIVKVVRDPKLGLLHINPGAAGKSGFHFIRTLVLMEIDGKEMKNLRIVELGPRTNEGPLEILPD